MCQHRHFCHFIPPQILEKLARLGDPKARASAKIGLHQSKLSRVKRAAKAVDMKVFTGGASAGEAPRQIWDSQNTWTQRKWVCRPKQTSDAKHGPLKRPRRKTVSADCRGQALIRGHAN